MKIASRVLIILLASIFSINMAIAGETETPQFLEGTVRVNAEEIIGLVEEFEDLIIIDSRKKSDLTKGYIEGSISLPNTETSPASLAKHIPSKSTPIVFYCNGTKCGRSMKAAKIAIADGYNKIYWFRGGMEEWEAKGLPVVVP